jgi:amino acid adenylation domain-containing protein
VTVFALHQLLDRAADRAPDDVALRADGDELAYGELRRRAWALAAALADEGVRPGDRVGIFMPKGVDAVTALYATMAAGAAYVPIDPASPITRAATIVRDCGMRAIVTTPDRATALYTRLADGPAPEVVVARSGDEPADLGARVIELGSAFGADASSPPASVVDTDLAYILYTSGSTGVPKGVMLTHRHALTFVYWSAATIGSRPDDRFSNHAPLHFDLSVFDLFVAAHGGAMVSMVPTGLAYFGKDLARFVHDEAITVWYSVPTALMMLAKAAGEGQRFPALRAVVFAGEVYPTKHIRELRAIVPSARLWNLYGPTETNVCTYHEVLELPEDDGPIPIGRACENTEVFALRDGGDVAAVGEEGELYVRGSSVMKGYWGRPDRSAEVLVPDPRRPEVPELVYRTGDLVRLRADGGWDFIGRRDHQIKSRGYRIELGEVEAALNADPALETAVAVAVPHADWGTAIVAFVVPRDGEEVAEIDIKRRATDRLPRPMIPARVEVRRTLPRTSTGKVDRRAIADEAAARAWSWA